MAVEAAKQRAAYPALPARVTSDLVIWTCVAFMTVVALALQLRAFPNHDVAWVLWGTREMLNGAAWGTDIIEPNPPLAWYLSMPAVWLSAVLATPIIPTFQVFVVCTALASVVVFDRLSRSSRPDTTPGHLPTLVAALFVLILPYRDFGQREHLMLMASLPYLALCARRFEHGCEVSRVSAIMVGAAAGLGFALKPYFLAVPFFVEILGFSICRRWSLPFRTETIALGAVVAIYAVAIVVLNSEYLTAVVPLVRTIYWSFNVPMERLVGAASLSLLATALVGFVAIKTSSRLTLVFCVATLGFAVSYFVQQKGYSYHLFPVTAGAAIAVSAAISQTSASRELRLAATLLLASVLLNPVLATITWWRLSGPGGAFANNQMAIIEAADRFAGDGGFLVIAVHPYPAFPTALYTSARYVSRTNSQWFLPAVNQLRNGRESSIPDVAKIAESNAREFILKDISHKPSLVILDRNAARHTSGRRDFDILSFYQEDERFRSAWAPYREVASVSGYRLFVRETDGSS